MQTHFVESHAAAYIVVLLLCGCNPSTTHHLSPGQIRVDSKSHTEPAGATASDLQLSSLIAQYVLEGNVVSAFELAALANDRSAHGIRPASSFSPPPRPECILQAIQSELEPGEGLLLYSHGGQGTVFSFLVTNISLTCTTLPLGRDTLAYWCKYYLSRISQNIAVPDSIQDILSAALLMPIQISEERLDTLIVVESQFIPQLPYCALRDPREGTSNSRELLVDTTTTSYLTHLSQLVQQDSSQSRAPITALVVGDPHPTPIVSLEPLEHARDEVVVLATVFEGTKLLMGADATESALKRELSTHSIIHIACHGIALPRPSLILAPTESDDGYLTTDEILTVSCQAKLVTLTACESAFRPDDGESGSPRPALAIASAFLFAGARSVVAVQWRIDSEAANLLIIEFYRRFGSASRSEALRQAQQTLRHTLSFESPYYWSGLYYYGDRR